MRILFVVAYVPSLIRVRPYQLIRGLARRQHNVVVATLSTNAGDRIDIENLTEQNIPVVAYHMGVWRSILNCVRALPTRQPLQSVYSWNPAFAARLAELVRLSPFDVVHVEHLRAAQYGIRLRDVLAEEDGRYGKRVPVVWDSVDSISHLFRQAQSESRSLAKRLITRLERRRTEAHEGWLAGQFDRVLVTSQADFRALEELARAYRSNSLEKLAVLHNGVDLDYFSFGERPRDSATLVLTGKMSYHANATAARYFVEDIMPRVWSRRPDVQVEIVGKDPPVSVRRLQNDSYGSRRVLVTGTVPDVRPYLWRATIAVAPMVYGAGIQNKVLEAMACGAPMITSEQGASALCARANQDLLVAPDAEEFASQILQLLDGKQQRDRLGCAGRRYVEQHHRWDHVAAQLESHYAEVITGPNANFQHTMSHPVS